MTTFWSRVLSHFSLFKNPLLQRIFRGRTTGWENPAPWQPRNLNVHAFLIWSSSLQSCYSWSHRPSFSLLHYRGKNNHLQ
jgi:hypothetical protein